MSHVEFSVEGTVMRVVRYDTDTRSEKVQPLKKRKKKNAARLGLTERQHMRDM